MIGVIFDAKEIKTLFPLTENTSLLLRVLGNKLVYEHIFDLFEELNITEILLITKDKKLKKVLEDKCKVFLVNDEIEGLYKLLKIDEDFLLIESNSFFDLNLLSLEKLREKGIFISKELKIDAFSSWDKILVEKIEGKTFSFSGISHFPFEITNILEEKLLKSFEEFLFYAIEEVNLVYLEGIIKKVEYPWDYLDANMYFLWKIKRYIGKNCDIWDKAILRKPYIIGDNSVVKNSVVEKSVIASNCLIGENSCVKRSVINSFTNIPHMNYIVDSVVGSNCNFGTGSNIATFKFDFSNIKMTFNEKKIDIGRSKFGAVIGDNVQIGCNAVIYPGKKIGNNVWVDANVLVKRDIESNKFVRLKFEEDYEVLNK